MRLNIKRLSTLIVSLLLSTYLFLVIGGRATGQTRRLRLVPHHITLARGRSFELNLPEGFGISVAAQGLKRIRFMANSPDRRIFVTDMYNLADNTRGVVYILDEFDEASKTFKKVTPYLQGLRNPNSIAFYTDLSGTGMVLPGPHRPSRALQVLRRRANAISTAGGTRQRSLITG